MATKFHIKDDGTPGQCGAATAESCPKTQAGDGFHGTFEEASVESERRFEESHGAVPSSARVSSSDSPSYRRLALEADYAAKSVALQAARDAEAKLIAEQKAYDEANGAKEGRARHKVRVVGSTSTKTVKGRNPKNGPTYYIPTKEQIDSRLDAKARIDTADRKATDAFAAVESKASIATKLSPSEQAQDLRDSVRDYRDTKTSEVERESIQDYWASQGISSQFAALNRAADIQNEEQRRKVAKGATPSSAHEGDAKPTLPSAGKRAESIAAQQISRVSYRYTEEEQAELRSDLATRLQASGDFTAESVRMETMAALDAKSGTPRRAFGSL